MIERVQPLKLIVFAVEVLGGGQLDDVKAATFAGLTTNRPWVCKCGVAVLEFRGHYAKHTLYKTDYATCPALPLSTLRSTLPHTCTAASAARPPAGRGPP